MQNENDQIETINIWICTTERAAGTGAAKSAVVALQNTYFTLSLVLLYSINYNFGTKLFSDYCLQTATWLCRYLTNYSPILSFNNYVPESNLQPKWSITYSLFRLRSLMLIVPGCHNAL